MVLFVLHNIQLFGYINTVFKSSRINVYLLINLYKLIIKTETDIIIW